MRHKTLHRWQLCLFRSRQQTVATREHAETRARFIEAHVYALQQTRFAGAESLSSVQHARVHKHRHFTCTKSNSNWNSQKCLVQLQLQLKVLKEI